MRAYPVLCRAVEEGIAYGWNRAHKHTGTPGEELIKGEIEKAVITEICETFDFDDEERE